MGAEVNLQKRIVKRLNSYCGCFFHRNHGSPYGRMGLPDIEGTCRGLYFGIEVKMPGKENTLTAIQKKTLRDIHAAGGVGVMVTSIEQAEEVVFDGVKRKKKPRKRPSYTRPNR